MAPKLKYENMIVTYIDILGFKERIESKSESDIYRILQTFNTFKTLTEYCHNTGDPNENVFNSVSASDCIIRITKIPPGESPSVVINREISVLAYNQLHLVSKDQIVLRGGLSFGDMFFRYDPLFTTFFGPAYIDAFNIESKLSVNPRIVIDDKCLNYIDSNIQPKLVNLANDGQLFIDYLENSKINPDTTEYDILNHKKAVETLILINKNKEQRIRDKYIWLALYHNNHIVKSGYPDKYFIDQNHILNLIP